MFLRTFIMGVVALLASALPVRAETASFVTPVSGDPASLAGVSDGNGVLVSPGTTIGLLLSEPFALFEEDGFTPNNNNIAIFGLSDIGSALVELSFGRFNNGSPQFFFSQQVLAGTAGTEVEFGFLAFVGCGAAGGCDFVQLSGVGAFNGSSGFLFDAVTFSDVPLAAVTGATPEPGVWALMIMGFLLTALRAKQLRAMWAVDGKAYFKGTSGALVDLNGSVSKSSMSRACSQKVGTGFCEKTRDNNKLEHIYDSIKCKCALVREL